MLSTGNWSILDCFCDIEDLETDRIPEYADDEIRTAIKVNNYE